MQKPQELPPTPSRGSQSKLHILMGMARLVPHAKDLKNVRGMVLLVSPFNSSIWPLKNPKDHGTGE